MEQSIVSNNAIIVSIEGTAFAVAPDGSLRELQPGDQLLAGEMLITGEGTQIGFYYSDDQYELGELSVTQLPGDGVAEPGQTLTAQNEVDVEALQAAILQGVDPTELFEATAAGGAPAAGGGGPGAGNGGFISISRSGAETIAEAGFDTSPVASDEQQQQDNVAVLADDTPSQSATLTLTTSDVTEDDGSIIFTATLSNPGQTAVTVVTDLGSIEIAAGETSGSLTVDNPNTDDVYLDSSSLTATVSDVQGGNFENVDFSAASATAQIGDTIDTTTVSLSTSDVTEADGTITFTATLSNPGQSAVTVVTDLGNIEIAAGETEGTLVVENPNGEDVYLDASSLTATVTDVQGGNFESVDFDGVSATAQIDDTVDTTT
ncbi:retention module-containing protein, partial [Aliagarivorans taiwanensis]|uniref:retention module-containing protein n=1 Tax=Aliagarivorans taiwanensis TaxID=561966 RepID=UPI00047B387B